MIEFNRSLCYATMALVHLAESPSMSVREMTSRSPCSHEHLGHLLEKLSAAGLVQRGALGASGWKLAAPSQEITLLRVYESLFGPVLVEKLPKPLANVPVAEFLRAVAEEVSASSRSLLGHVTLAQIVKANLVPFPGRRAS